PGELRARRDGDVRHLHCVESRQCRHGLLAGVSADRADRVRPRRADRARGHPPGGERAGARRRRGVHRLARDPEQHRRLDLQLHHQELSEPVPRGARHPLHVTAPGGRTARHPAGAGAAVCLLPLHAARAGDARGGPEPGIEPPRRHPRRLDAGAWLGTRRRGRRHRGNDGGADRVSRSEHDGGHPALRLRRGAARRHRLAGRCGGRGTCRRRARKPARRFRHRQRVEAGRRAGAQHRCSAGAPLGLLRQRAGVARMSNEKQGLRKIGTVPVFLTLVLLLVACVLPFVVSNYRTFQLTLVLVYAIALLGLNILTGYNGQISLGHGAFYAIGAYVAAMLMDQAGMPYWATIPIAGVVCLVVGFLFGLPALRLEGLYLALATFALAVSMPPILKAHFLEKWTGGVQGIVIVKPDPPAWLAAAGVKLNADQWLYYFVLAIALVLFVVGWNLISGRIGRA